MFVVCVYAHVYMYVLLVYAVYTFIYNLLYIYNILDIILGKIYN